MTNETKERNEAIYLEWKSGYSELALAIKYNILESTVRKIILGKTNHNIKKN